MSFLKRLLLVSTIGLFACTSVPQVAVRPGKSIVQTFNQTSVQVLAPADIPTSILETTYQSAQDFADKTSQRRKIEYFKLHSNPVGLKIGQGTSSLYLLSYQGTAKTRADLNVELRVLHSSLQEGLSLNYSGPVTWSGAQSSPLKLANQTPTPLTFELLMGLPGSSYTRAYSEYLEHLASHLRRRYQSRPFQFNDSPFVYAVKRGDDVKGFIFTNQHNRLILGERKYADIQSVVFIGTSRTIDGAYTLIGFNPKTLTPDSSPVYQISQDRRLGTFFQFGEL